MTNEQNDNGCELVEIQFYDATTGYENLWALPLGEGRYKLENVPLFIYDLALDDIVTASKSDGDHLHFLAIVERSGNRTLRARSDDLLADAGVRSHILAELEGMGCKVESHRDQLLAISVPPTAQLETVADRLTAMHLSWEYGRPSDLNT